MDTDGPLTGATWRKSTYSGNNGANCVEVAMTSALVGVRDTKNRDGATLTVTSDEWRAFLAWVKADAAL